MDVTVLLIFLFVYIGMFLGGIPGLALDRTGVALVGAVLLILTGSVTLVEARDCIDIPTITLLFGLMIVSAQFRLGGFYVAVSRRITSAELSPRALLALLTAVSGFLSALLANDIVCLAMTPILIEGCARRKLNPLPFLLALACASNIGSAATLIGNPQNMLIGQTLALSFSGYLLDALVPSVGGLVITWLFLCQQFKDQWGSAVEIKEADDVEFNRWQTAKGVIAVVLLLAIFLFTDYPREIVTIGIAAVLLLSRRMASRDFVALVDWHLLLLFIGLFIVNHALAASGWLEQMMTAVSRAGIDLSNSLWLFFVTAVLSNLVSNVPAVMLLIPSVSGDTGGTVLALSSTLAGNFIIVGSIANIIVADKAKEMGIELSWREHARTGVPVTVATFMLSIGWILLYYQ